MTNNFREEVIKYLNLLNKDIEIVLKKLIEYNYPKEVNSLSFEIFSDGFTDNFPVRAFFMNAENCEYFIYNKGKAEYPSPVDPGLLNIHYVYPYEVEEKYSKDDEIDPWSIATEELILWFSERWNNSGGKNFKLNATISHHDSNHYFNLIEMKWEEFLN